ncbi:response regulator transcription factor [Geodermatophilus sp. SYSU D00710]
MADGGPSARTRLLLADHHRSFVQALAIRLDQEPDLEVVAAVTDAQEVLEFADGRLIDIAVLDVAEPGGFLEASDRLRVARPQVHLVAVAADDDVAVLARAVRQGFRAWVSKELGVAALLDGLRVVRRGGTVIPPVLLTRLLTHLLDEQEKQRNADVLLTLLTSREIQVLRAMTRGLPRYEIAAELGISLNTVRTHVQGILAKLDVNTSLAAVALARRAGMG